MVWLDFRCGDPSAPPSSSLWHLGVAVLAKRGSCGPLIGLVDEDPLRLCSAWRRAVSLRVAASLQCLQIRAVVIGCEPPDLPKAESRAAKAGRLNVGFPVPSTKAVSSGIRVTWETETEGCKIGYHDVLLCVA